MKPIFRKFFANLMVILIPTFFCSIMASPISYGLPLNCPEGSRVIGIECFDADYNNTTPWYRRDFGATQLSFPFFLAGFSAFTIWNFFTTPTSEFDRSKKKISSVAPRPQQTAQPSKTSATKSKRWLPANCPNCGGTTSSRTVEWVSDYEAKCPYCGSVLKEE